MSESKFPYATEEQVRKGKSVAWLSYLGIFFVIPLSMERENPYAMHHVRQGITLLIFRMGLVIGIMLLWILGLIIIAAVGYPIGSLILMTIGYGLMLIVGLVGSVFAIIGLVKAASGNLWKIPIIGGLGERWFGKKLACEEIKETTRRKNMYCRNCGKEVAQNAEYCIHCGVKPLNANKFCQNCAAQTNPEQEVCLSCGVRLKKSAISAQPYTGDQKDWLTTLLLAIFLGTLGVHRFYTGHIGIGVVQLLTAGGCGIWTLIDIIMIATGDFKDAEGKLLHKS